MKVFFVFWVLLVVICVVGCEFKGGDYDSYVTYHVVDDSGCGNLGYKCRSGEVCLKESEEGVVLYRCGCEEGKVSCPGEKICGTQILGDDMNNCGACGRKCRGEGERCERGKCVCYEDGKGVDLQTGHFVDGSGKAKSCGICGYECDKGSEGSEIVCEGGLCADLSCELGFGGKRKMRCDGECRDLMMDELHCGRCGRRCEDVNGGGEAQCSVGECKCGGGKVACGGAQEVCVVESDKVCGEKCEDCTKLGKYCVEGICRCKEGEVPCGDVGQCVAQGDKQCGESCSQCDDGLYCSMNGQCVKKGAAVCGESGSATQLACGVGEVCDCGGKGSGYRCWDGQCGCMKEGGQLRFCGVGEVCVEGECKCGSGSACGVGEICVKGVCKCGSGSACGVGEICVEGVCKCGSGSACGVGEICVEGVCKCGSGSACGVGEICVKGVCKCGSGSACGGGSVCKDGKCRCGGNVCSVEGSNNSALKCGGLGGKKIHGNDFCGCGEGWVSKYHQGSDKSWQFEGCFKDCEGVKCGVGAGCYKRSGELGYLCRCYDSIGEFCGGEGSVCGDGEGKSKCVSCGGNAACGGGSVCVKGKCKCGKNDCSVSGTNNSALMCGGFGGKQIHGNDFCGCGEGWVSKYHQGSDKSWQFEGCFKDCEGVKCGVGAGCYKRSGELGYLCRCYDSIGEFCGGEGSVCGEGSDKKKCVSCGGGGACGGGSVCKDGECKCGSGEACGGGSVCVNGKCRCGGKVCSVSGSNNSALKCGGLGGKKIREDDYCGCGAGWVSKNRQSGNSWIFEGCFKDCEGVKCGVGTECVKSNGGYKCRCYNSRGEICEGEGSLCGNKDKGENVSKCVSCGGGKACGAGETCVNGVCKCGSGEACGVGGVCKNGVCKCGSGEACGEGKVCKDGNCVAEQD